MIYRNGGAFNLRYVTNSGTVMLDSSAGGSFVQTNAQIVLTLPAGGYPQIYLNGALLYTSSVIMSSLPTPTYFYLGNSLDTTNRLYGSINEFRIWGGALSASDIFSDYQQGPGG
jgi:hypothetical protein